MAARTPSRSSIAANSGDQSELSPALELAVVIQDLGGCCTFSRVPLPNIRDGGQLWATARRLVFGSSTLEIISAGMARCFVKIVVGVGAIQVHTISSVNPDDRLRISLHGFGADGRLTEAFRDPAVLPNDTNRIINIERFAIRAPNSINLEGQNAIVIRKIFDKTKIAWFLGFLLMISPSVGLVVGLTTHNVGAGVTASVGVFALASCVQGLATWFHT